MGKEKKFESFGRYFYLKRGDHKEVIFLEERLKNVVRFWSGVGIREEKIHKSKILGEYFYPKGKSCWGNLKVYASDFVEK